MTSVRNAADHVPVTSQKWRGYGMAGSSKDVDAARMALERARGDLETQLAAEPAWAALEQLEARIARGEPPPGIDYEALKSRLARQIGRAHV